MVSTRRSRNSTVADVAAMLAISKGGNRELRKLLGVRKPVRRKPTTPRSVLVPRSPSPATTNNGTPSPVSASTSAAFARASAAQDAEISRLLRIIDQVKAGRSVAVNRALRDRERPDFRTINLFKKEDFLIDGQPYRRPEVAWSLAQRTDAQNRKRAATLLQQQRLLEYESQGTRSLPPFRSTR